MFHTITLFMLLLRAPFAADPFEPTPNRFSPNTSSVGESAPAPPPEERTCRKIGRVLVCTKKDPDNIPVDF